MPVLRDTGSIQKMTEEMDDCMQKVEKGGLPRKFKTDLLALSAAKIVVATVVV